MKKIILLAIVFLGIYWGAKIYSVWSSPNSDSTQRISIFIKPGTSVQKISELLLEKKLIKDAFVFRLYVKHHDMVNKLQAGEYILQRNLTFAEVSEQLQHGKSSEQKITIPEGYTIAQIDALLTKKSLIDAGEFVKCASSCDFGFDIDNMEGWLYPSTYFVSTASFSSKNFMKRLYQTMQGKLKPFRDDMKKTGRTNTQIMIVASMIEREAFGDSLEEKKKISGIIWKRLDEGIALGIDATTRYEKNDWKGALYTKDFESTSRYNTRRIPGLPPTAISNPSVDSIKSAIYPEKTKYYYYLHDRKGKIHYGETLDDHVKNKKYL